MVSLQGQHTSALANSVPSHGSIDYGLSPFHVHQADLMLMRIMSMAREDLHAPAAAPWCRAQCLPCSGSIGRG